MVAKFQFNEQVIKLELLTVCLLLLTFGAFQLIFFKKASCVVQTTQEGGNKTVLSVYQYPCSVLYLYSLKV